MYSLKNTVWNIWRDEKNAAKYKLKESVVPFDKKTLTNLERQILKVRNETAHDKTNKMACAPSEDSDQPGHPSSLIRVFAVRPVWSESSLSRALSAWRKLGSLAPAKRTADTQADLNLRWAQSHFVGFVMRRLILEMFKIPHINPDTPISSQPLYQVVEREESATGVKRKKRSF